MTDILNKTLDEMPDVFTSNEFNRKAVSNGYPKDRLKQTGLARYLHLHAFNDKKFKKTWTKRSKTKHQDEVRKNNYVFKSFDEIVLFLKTKGYRVMKPINQWEEL